MPKVSLAFFTAAVLCLLGGMVWGVIMGMTQNFILSPAHAHLNLVGWATLGLMGTFYALRGSGGRLAWINFALSTLGVAVMVPALAIYLNGNKAADPALIAGSLIVVLGMLTFLGSVLGSWGRPRTPAA